MTLQRNEDAMKRMLTVLSVGGALLASSLWLAGCAAKKTEGQRGMMPPVGPIHAPVPKATGETTKPTEKAPGEAAKPAEKAPEGGR